MEGSEREFRVNVNFGGSTYGGYRYRAARRPEVGETITVENLSGKIVTARVTQVKGQPGEVDPWIQATALDS